jgi:hypothetical protein
VPSEGEKKLSFVFNYSSFSNRKGKLIAVPLRRETFQ